MREDHGINQPEPASDTHCYGIGKGGQNPGPQEDGSGDGGRELEFLVQPKDDHRIQDETTAERVQAEQRRELLNHGLGLLQRRGPPPIRMRFLRQGRIRAQRMLRSRHTESTSPVAQPSGLRPSWPRGGPEPRRRMTRTHQRETRPSYSGRTRPFVRRPARDPTTRSPGVWAAPR